MNAPGTSNIAATSGAVIGGVIARLDKTFPTNDCSRPAAGLGREKCAKTLDTLYIGGDAPT